MKRASSPCPKFSKTSIPGLYRHRNGKYYSRLRIHGKRQYRALDTKLKSEAVEWLRDHLHLALRKSMPDNHDQACASAISTPKTFRDCLKIARYQLELHPTLSPKSKVQYRDGLKDVERYWQLLDQKSCRAGLVDVPISSE